MATTSIVITQTPKDLINALSLADDTLFRFTNYGGGEMRIAAQTASPTDDTYGHPIPPGEDEYFTTGSLGVWVWTTGKEDIVGVLTEG